MSTELPEDPQRRRLRERLETIQIRTEKARSWGDTTRPLRSLINREGYVPVTTRLAGEDLEFLAGAREELLSFSELGIRLLDLHQPRDAGGITSDTAHPILRCRSCMWRWPCPTFRAMSEAFATRDHNPDRPGTDQARVPEPEPAPEPIPGPEPGTDLEPGTGLGPTGPEPVTGLGPTDPEPRRVTRGDGRTG